jgi:hypothetical protein
LNFWIFLKKCWKEGDKDFFSKLLAQKNQELTFLWR